MTPTTGRLLILWGSILAALAGMQLVSVPVGWSGSGENIARLVLALVQFVLGSGLIATGLRARKRNDTTDHTEG